MTAALPLPNQNEAQTCAGLCSTTGFAAAHAAHRGPLTAKARALLDDPQLAEDVVQEVFARAWAACGSFDPTTGPPLRAWLSRILRNVVIDMARAAGARPRLHLASEDGVPEHPDPDDAIERVTQRLALLDGLAEVSPAHRAVVLDVVVRDRPHREVAAELGLPAGTVRSRLFHALRGLRSELAA